ncbi:MAG: hypothetical protein IT422_26995 [Pirellulaceae bacterium]|nr:hypothetical protein [Pirellulaceae bacterium]
MLNCKDMTKVISDSLDRKITLRQRLELWMHIMMCGLCRRFRSNALAIRKKVRETSARPSEKVAASEPEAAPLSPAARNRIAAAMKEQLG